MIKRIGWLIMAASVMAGFTSAQEAGTRLLRNPDVSGDKVVFVYGGDLWTASFAGGMATRLTTHPGQEDSPRFSPDGKWIAFNGEYDGNVDVFIIPATGGVPRRLTWHPGADSVTGWSADGRDVLFSSVRASYSRFARIFRVSATGGFPEALPMPMAWLGSISPGGKQYAYTSLSNRQSFNTWRRYRGGHAPFIWIFDLQTHDAVKIPHAGANDTFPCWMADEVYFLSDRDRAMNVYAWHPAKKVLRQITRFAGADVKSLGAAGGQVIIEQDGYLHQVDPRSGKTSRILITVPGEGLCERPRFVRAGQLINNFDISPTGKRAVVEARGEILTLPAEKGDIRNLTNSTDRAEREPAWSPDGARIAYFGEHEGEYVLKIADQLGQKPPRVIPVPGTSYYFKPVWSPDGKKILFRDNHLNLFCLNVEDGKAVLVDREDMVLDTAITMSTVWSPDSRWIAYDKLTSNYYRVIHLYNLESGKATRLTDALSDACSPVFDRSGKYLYFAASTNKAFNVNPLDISANLFQPVSQIYLAVLAKNEPSPFKPESDEEGADESKKDGAGEKKPADAKPAAGEEKKEEGKKEKPEAAQPVPVVIDLEGLSQRIIALDLPPGGYSSLQTGAEKTLFFLEQKAGEEAASLHRYDLKEKKDETVLPGIREYRISFDGKKLAYRTDSRMALVDAAGQPKPGAGELATGQLEVWISPPDEWRQMLREAWRIQREYFYDPGMHGQDWPKIWQKYESYLPYIAHRSDLNYLIGMLIGELAVGHAYVGGGLQPDPGRVPGGLLGADYELAGGYYRFKKIYSGWNWNPGLRAPLTEPGVDVRPGDYLLEVNGVKLTDKINIYSLFEKTAGRQVLLKVNSEPKEEGARVVTVVPAGSESGLRNRDWIESNRRKVAGLSGGKLGYIYLPDTGDNGYAYFNRDFFAQLDKEGLVIDERFNGGGQAADYIVDMLNRPVLSYWLPRDGGAYRTPAGSVAGPKVMLINEYAGSGGDALPCYFHRRGLGKLVGKRTWGGLVGISGYPPLLDGGFVTSPCFAVMSPDGKFEVENVGVPPDVEVEWTPAAVIAGGDPQLEKAVQIAMEEIKTKPLPKFKPEPYPRGR